MTEMVLYTIKGSKPGKIILMFRQCPSCGEFHDLTVDEYKFEEWADGVLSLEQAFPDLTPAERELFLTAIDGDCFQKMREEIEKEEDGET